MKMFIDSQFKDTKRIIIFQTLLYILSFIVPFIIQAFSNNPDKILPLNIVCLISSIIFFANEMLQLYYKGGKMYFIDWWNLFDVMHFLIYLTYFSLRIDKLENDKHVIPIKSELGELVDANG